MSNQPTTPIIVEVDCSTGVATERPMTEQEIANHAMLQEKAIADIAEREQARATQAASLASAQAKLTSLGLTAEEVTAITGQPVTTPTS